MKTFFFLLIGHAFSDFVFQGDTMAKGKNRHRKTEPPPGAQYQPTWFYWLTAHSLVHGGMVYLMTNRLDCAVVEVIAHWLIDFGKCENWYGIHTDQSLHILFKVFYCL